MTLATPANRERVYRALIRLGFGGSSVSEIASESALSCEVVTACLGKLLESGMCETVVKIGNRRAWRTSRSVASSVHAAETANSAKATQLNTR